MSALTVADALSRIQCACSGEEAILPYYAPSLALIRRLIVQAGYVVRPLAPSDLLPKSGDAIEFWLNSTSANNLGKALPQSIQIGHYIGRRFVVAVATRDPEISYGDYDVHLWRERSTL